jgi:predicted transporter
MKKRKTTSLFISKCNAATLGDMMGFLGIVFLMTAFHVVRKVLYHSSSEKSLCQFQKGHQVGILFYVALVDSTEQTEIKKILIFAFKHNIYK